VPSGELAPSGGFDGGDVILVIVIMASNARFASSPPAAIASARIRLTGLRPSTSSITGIFRLSSLP